MLHDDQSNTLFRARSMPTGRNSGGYAAKSFISIGWEETSGTEKQD
jgi:hypothetical protein